MNVCPMIFVRAPRANMSFFVWQLSVRGVERTISSPIPGITGLTVSFTVKVLTILRVCGASLSVLNGCCVHGWACGLGGVCPLWSGGGAYAYCECITLYVFDSVFVVPSVGQTTVVYHCKHTLRPPHTWLPIPVCGHGCELVHMVEERFSPRERHLGGVHHFA